MAGAGRALPTANFDKRRTMRLVKIAPFGVWRVQGFP